MASAHEIETVGSPDMGSDAEKMASARVVPANFADQIPRELLHELAPNDEADEAYLLDRINEMSEEEALAVVTESLKFHGDDWNFPSEMRDRMTRLLQGPKLYGDFYDRDLRIDAVLMRYSSPYPGVRAVAEIRDDQNVPIETIRAYFLGIGWAVIGTFFSTFFNSRFPSIGECAVLKSFLPPAAVEDIQF